MSRQKPLLSLDFWKNLCYNPIKQEPQQPPSQIQIERVKFMNESEKEFMELWKQLNEENKDEIYNRIYEYIEENARERRNNENYY